jgi:hypothetical protein
MKVLFINNDGGGFADTWRSTKGRSGFFKREFPHGQPENYLIRVNRQPAAADQVLQDQDRVSCTATKIEGAV